MEKNIKIPDTIALRKEFKRKFNFRELYRSLIFIPGAFSKLIKNNTNNLIDKNFIERLKLAVTEVNGCSACSYQHTKMALQQGMSNEEIMSFLSGGNQFVKPEEAKAIMFAQHFAESKGFPKKYTYDSIVKEYGEEQSLIILSATQIALAGNMYGSPFSAFQSRLKGQPYKGSSLFYELRLLLGGIIFLPIALIHGLLRSLVGLSNKRLDKNSTDE